MFFRSSCPKVFCKKGVLRNFVKFAGKHLCQSLFLNKVAALRPATLFQKRLWHRCFPVNFTKFLRTSFLKEHLWWLLLVFQNFEISTGKHLCWSLFSAKVFSCEYCKMFKKSFIYRTPPVAPSK